jgi:hypothetical protein
MLLVMPISLSAGGPGNRLLLTDCCCSDDVVVVEASFGGDERRNVSAVATMVSSSLRLILSFTRSDRHLAEKKRTKNDYQR